MFNYIKRTSLILLSGFFLFGCQTKHDPNIVKVGVIAGPETELMQVAAEVAKKRYGLTVKPVIFSDYVMPNEALNNGNLDANAFQHKPYLDAQIQSRGYKITAIGKTFIYPMGLYSKKIKTLSQLPNNAKVGIPNDPSNEARALLLLQKAKLIQLKKGITITATPQDIVSNPKKLQFIELDAAQLPRSLGDITIAAINTNYAVPAGLSPAKDALLSEGADSPYVNIIAVQEKDKDKKQLLELVKAFQSPAVIKKAKQLFGDSAKPAFTANTSP